MTHANARPAWRQLPAAAPAIAPARAAHPRDAARLASDAARLASTPPRSATTSHARQGRTPRGNQQSDHPAAAPAPCIERHAHTLHPMGKKEPRARRAAKLDKSRTHFAPLDCSDFTGRCAAKPGCASRLSSPGRPNADARRIRLGRLTRPPQPHCAGRRTMQVAHLRALHAANRAQAFEPPGRREMSARGREQLRLVLALAQLLQHHAVARFETQCIEQIAQMHERLGQTHRTRRAFALLVLRAQQLRVLRERRSQLRERLFERRAPRIEPRPSRMPATRPTRARRRNRRAPRQSIRARAAGARAAHCVAGTAAD